jgi:hypothetical protein
MEDLAKMMGDLLACHHNKGQYEECLKKAISVTNYLRR